MDSSSLRPCPKKQKLEGGEDMERSSRSLSDLPDEILRKVIPLLDPKDAIRTSVLSKRWEFLWTFIPKSLSILPDVILQSIISRLGTKDAIKTSVLSKRWEYLWTSIPHLEFYESPGGRSSLVSIVDRALLIRGPSDIKVFSLSFPRLRDVCRFNAWISAAVRRNVQDLFIHLYDANIKQPISLPHSLFTSTRLMALKLHIPFLFKVPPTVCFSSLRDLSLKSVVFSDDSAQQLFSGCPVLENLYLDSCSWVNVQFVSICAPKLLKLTIDEGDLKLTTGSDGCQIMIFGVSLTRFVYWGEFENDYCFHDSSLHEVKITILPYFDGNWRQIAYRLYKLLRGLSSVKCLTFSYCTWLQGVPINAPELLAQLPLFNNLTTLVFEDSVNIDNKLLLALLRCCPCLDRLVVYQGIRLYSEDDGVLEPLPPCFLSHLKTIEICGFTGDPDHFRALKILLKNAMVLEKVVLGCTRKKRGSEEKTELAKQLADLHKGSQICKIELD